MSTQPKESKQEEQAYTPPDGLHKVDGQQFENHVRNTKCTEHFYSGATHYLQTGTRLLVALFVHDHGGHYMRLRHLRIAGGRNA